MSITEPCLETMDLDALPEPMRMILAAGHKKGLRPDRIVFGCKLNEGRWLTGLADAEALITMMAKAKVPFKPDVEAALRRPFDGVGIRILLVADGQIKLGRSVEFTGKGGAA